MMSHIGWGGEQNTLYKDVRPWRGWIVMSHIGWGGEQNTLPLGCGNLPVANRF